MGWQPEEDEDDWELLSDEALKELSPLLDTRKHSRFHLIERQRAAYFADVGENEDIDASKSDANDSEYAEDIESYADEGAKSGGERSKDEERFPASGFADLSTWYCDAFPPVHPKLAIPVREFVPPVSIVDQPTLLLSALPAASLHSRADMPTLPILPAVSAVGTRNGRASDGPLSPGAEKARGKLVPFCWRFLRAWLRHIRCVMCIRRVRQPASKGHALLLERLRARQQRGSLPRQPSIPANGRPARQFRLPADSLFS